MRKLLTVVACAMAFSLACATLADAATYKVDNLGRKWLVDEATAATPGAGSGEGALIGLAGEEEPAFARHMFDLQFGVGAVGIASDADSTDKATTVSSLTLMYYPPTATGWLKLGPRFAWDGTPLDAGSATKMQLSLPITAYLFPDPFSSFKWGVEMNILPSLSVLVDTGEDAGIRDSAWSYKPGVAFFFEVPMGLWSAQMNVGGAFPIQIEGVSDSEVNPNVGEAQVGVTAQVNWRLGR